MTEELVNQINRAHTQLAKNIPLALKIIDELPENPSLSLIHSFSTQLRELRTDLDKFNTAIGELKQINPDDEKVERLVHVSQRFEEQLIIIENRAPTTRGEVDLHAPLDSSEQVDNEIKPRSFQQILQYIEQYDQDKEQQIKELEQNAKKLNQAAGTFKETLTVSVEKMDDRITLAQETKDKVKNIDEGIKKFEKQVKKDYFFWWCAADLLCLGVLTMLIIFVFWGIPPVF